MSRGIVRHQAVGGQFQHRLHLHLAGTAARAGAGGVANRLEAAGTGVHRGDNFALGNAVAVANLGVVGHIFNIQRRRGIPGQGEEQLRAVVGQRLAPVKGLQDARHRQAVAQQDGAGNLALPNNHFLVHVPVGLHVGNHFVVVIHGVFVAGHRQLNAHDLELGGYA